MLETIQMIDENILIFVKDYLRVEILNPIVKIFTSLGNVGMLWIAITIIMILYKPTRKIGIQTILALLFSVIITNLTLKLIVARPRPYVTMTEFVPLLKSSDPNSFPSGHTSTAFAAGMVWAKLFSKKWIKAIAVTQAICMGLSRIYVGVHYPSDVLTGVVVGTCCAVLSLIIFKKLYTDKNTL